MKLAEAANILGVHPDTPIETLKQTYRRLALAWHPDKCSNPNAKEKFQQISIAYTKLISAKCIGGRRLEDENSDDTSSGKRSVDSHEMAAFMRMFMDLVGIFNEDQSLSEDGKIPAAGVSFGMMFGSRPGTSDEWSTEDEADPEELDDEDDDDEEDDDDCYGSDEEGPNADGTTWEPPAKHYSQMNLKEEASKERQSKLCEETEKGNELLEAKRKLKNAKKRAEKRRKQREKKTREAAIKEDEEEELRQLEETKKREKEEAQSKLENNLRLQLEAKAKQRVDLFDVLRSGNLAKVKCFIGDTLETTKSPKTAAASGSSQLRARVMRELVATQPLLHCCVGEPASHLAGKEGSKILGEGRLAVAKYLLGQRTRPIDLGITDDDGRTALHLAAKREDPAMIRLLLSAREENPDRKAQLDINARCRKSGWTPLHYASSQGDVPSLKLLLEAGASLVVHAGSGKGATPLEVVKSRLQNAGHFSAAHIANLQQVAKELSEGMKNLEKVKHQKEAERVLKEEKLEAAKKKLAEREEKERELLERKQKQLKDKQDRDRQRDEEESNKKPLKVAPTPPTNTPVSKGANTPVSVPHTRAVSPNSVAATKPSVIAAAATAETVTTTVDSSIKVSKKKLKKDRKKEEEDVPVPVSTPAVPKIIAVVDVASRDELVDHLLAMGFPEADCLTAISLYGKDLDRALSWLCDRPPVAPTQSATATGGSNTTPSITAAVSSAVNPRQDVSGSGISTQSSAQKSEALRLQKERDHKEELRRINRAWNQKAEDEKRRADAEKKQKEDERQKDGHLQQVILKQQQQQQFLQQQHLHQLLAQHQLQQQRSQMQQQVLQRTPGTPGYGYGTVPKSDLEPPPMSYTGSVAPGTRQFQNALGQPSAMHNQNVDAHPPRMDLNLGYLQTRSGSPNVINPIGSNMYPHNLMSHSTTRVANMGSHEFDLSQRDELKGSSRGISSTLSAYNELQIQSRIRAATLSGNTLPQSASSNSLQYDPQVYSSASNGPSQGRVLHQLPYSQTQQGSQHFLPLTQTLQTQGQGQGQGQGPPPMRPIVLGQSPLGWDDNNRLRSIDSSPPGQSQQVFQSQQQLQEQESSRLHHQSQSLSQSLLQSQSQSRQYQYVTNDTSGDDEEFVDNSLELSIKAKPFVPQYSKSPATSLPPPMTQSLGMNALQLSHQPQSYLNSNVSAAVLGGLPVPSSSMADPWGAVPTQTHTAQHGQRSQVFEKHSSGFNMPMLSALSPINAPTLGLPGSLQSLSSQPSPYSAILRSFSSDRTSDTEVRAVNGSHPSYSSNLGGSLMQDLGSIDHYGSNIVDDLERDDSYPDAIPSILSGLLMHKSSTTGLGAGSSARGLGSDRYQTDSNSNDARDREMNFLRDRDRGGPALFRDQGPSQSGQPDIFESSGGFSSSAFGGRPGSFLSSHMVSNNQDSIAGLMRGAGQTFQAER